ncbi:hypothetical protein P43SY_001759 [Pythium insidiosum]|uniref:Uncharacterized protein n=1 Tax=Pythium insidiosum TaxID=114742 RepID=A0AAD5LMV8_PYTIN|nr:hypothetical protein P43SY_001759 [Pythium insidiosum]
MPGLPNPPELERAMRQPRFVDLWELTWDEHKQNFRAAWLEYKASFSDAPDVDIEASKRELRDAARRLRGHVEENTSSNLALIEDKLEGSQLLDNVRELSSTARGNAQFLKQELAHVNEHVDPEQLKRNVETLLHEHRSKKDVISTVSSNVEELVDLVKTGREAAAKMDAQDVDALKSDAQSWFADKLGVAQTVLMAFIEGYREGKTAELEREDALLITFAKQAAQDQKVILKEQLDRLAAARDPPRAMKGGPPVASKPSPRSQQPQLQPQHRRPSRDELVRLEKVDFSDDEDDDIFQYAAMDDAALDDDGDDDEEDFEAVLRNLQRSTATEKLSPERPEAAASVSQLPSLSKSQASSSAELALGAPSSPTGTLPRLHTQVRPAVVDDFIRNFLIKLGMSRTLDTFNHEWYEFIAKGKLKEDDVGVVPDIYLRNQALDDQVKELRRQLDETRRVTEQAKGTWDKFRRQRDVHKMHHQRVLQEKDALSAKIKKLEKHIAAYEPLLNELKAKYENSMKEKMLMRLERDRQVAKAEALEAQLKALNGQGGAPTKPRRDKDSDAGPSTKDSSSSAASSSSAKPAAGSKKKTSASPATSGAGSDKAASSGAPSSSSSAGDTKLPTQDGVNPFLDKRFEPVAPDRLELAKTCQGHANAIAAVAFHPKNPILATVSDDQTWKLWSAPQCELIMSGEGHRSWLAGIAFHPRGTHVATSSGDHTVKLWDFVNASCSLTLSDHAQPVWESAFHHDGDFLVSASMDHTCKLWDLATGRCRKTFRGHVDSVNAVCFQPFTSNLCTASGDKTVSIWDLRSGLCVQTFYGHQNACNAVAFALQGDTIASCDADGFVKVWDVRMVAERCTLDGGQHPLNGVAFDRSGKTLVAASDDATVKVLSLKSETLVRELKAHDAPVQSVCFDPSGRFLASSSSDCTFRLWST